MISKRNNIAQRGALLALLFLLYGGTAGAEMPLFKSKSSSTVNIDGISYYVHTVKQGETLYSLSKLYDVSQEEIVKSNPQVAEGLRVDQVIKIPSTSPAKQLSEKQQARKFDIHIVKQGETAYSISRSYGLSVATLTEDNPAMDPTQLSIGQQLNIRRNQVGLASDRQLSEQWNQYAQTLSSVTTDGVYHLVQPGETLYGLSQKYGVSQHDIIRENDIQTAGLKAGMMLKIPTVDQTKPQRASSVASGGTSAQEEKKGGFMEDILGITNAKSLDAQRALPGSAVNVAVLLPLKGTASTSGRNFLEFYQGVLLGAEDLKRAGISSQINLYDSERSVDKVEEIVGSPTFKNTDLIIGPVYEDVLAPALEYAEQNRIAVVSPLAQLEQTNNPLLYQLSPDPASKYDKLRRLFSSDRRVVVVSSSALNDKEFEQEITPLLPANVTRITYSPSTPGSVLDNLIRGDKETVLVVLHQEEYSVEQLLARISSIQTNLVSRGASVSRLTVVGSSRWQRFANIDKNLYFKVNLCYITSYHADRSNPDVMAFNKRYIAAFGALPSLYAYRGYDAAKLFINNVAIQTTLSFEHTLNGNSVKLLQMPYNFSQQERGDTHINNQWALVCYRNDYTINVE